MNKLTKTEKTNKSTESENIKESLDETDMTIALAGNANVGKSVIFNELTGSNQIVGNWPGKTIETS